MPIYGDSRDRMHPGVAKAVPNSPEAKAILNGDNVRSLSFGDLVSMMTERGIVKGRGIDVIAARTSSLLDISIDEFHQRLGDPAVISWYELSLMAEGFKQRQREAARNTKIAETKAYLADKLSRRDPHLADLQAITEQQQQRVTFLRGLAEKASTIQQAGLMQQKLRKWEIPRLEALKASSFAIPLHEFIDLLADDEILASDEHNYARDVINHFADELVDQKILGQADMPEAWMQRRLNQFSADELDEFSRVWLCEEDMAIFAEAHFDVWSRTHEGITELRGQRHPMLDIFYITDEQSEDFFQRYPLTH